MNYAIRVLDAEYNRLMLAAKLARTSAENQRDTARGRAARDRYLAEAQRLNALLDDVALAIVTVRRVLLQEPPS